MRRLRLLLALGLVASLLLMGGVSAQEEEAEDGAEDAAEDGEDEEHEEGSGEEECEEAWEYLEFLKANIK